MGDERPPHFYKYVTLQTAKVILESSTIRWSTPRTFNDPWDIQFDLQVNVDNEAVKRAALAKLWQAYYGDEPSSAGNAFGDLIRLVRPTFPRLRKAEFEREFGEAIDEALENAKRNLPRHQAEIRNLLADSKILCLTTDPANILMWTHYADQHRGVVLRFRSVDGLDSPWSEARPVNYLRDLPILMDEDLMSDVMSGRAALDGAELTSRMVYTKSDAFSYEQEWRIFAGRGRNPTAAFEDLRFDPLELDEVTLGLRIDADGASELSSVVKRRYPHADLMKARLSERAYGLEIAPL